MHTEPINFCHWLQGFLETANPTAINKEQTKIIKDHLALVFTKVTPDYTKLPNIVDHPIYNNPVTPNPYAPPYTVICGGSTPLPHTGTIATIGRTTTSQASGYPEGTTVSNGETSVKYCANATNLLFP